MDPDQNLADQLRLSARLQAIVDKYPADLQDLQETAGELAELVESLHRWIVRGGALPEAWANPRERFRWTFELEIDPDVVADGLAPTSEQLSSALQRAFPHARSSGIRATVTTAPDADAIAREQGRK